MDKEELIARAARRAAYSPECVEAVYRALTDTVGEAMMAGEDVLLSPELGNFLVELSESPGRNGCSPKAPRVPHYRVRFRISRELQKRLKLGDTSTQVLLQRE